MGERAQHLADRARGRADALPNAAVVHRNASQQKPRLAQSGEVGGDQFPPLLALTPLRGEVRGYRSDVVRNGARIHCALSLFDLLRGRYRRPEYSADFGQRLCRQPDFSLRRA